MGTLVRIGLRFSMDLRILIIVMGYEIDGNVVFFRDSLYFILYIIDFLFM